MTIINIMTMMMAMMMMTQGKKRLALVKELVIMPEWSILDLITHAVDATRGTKNMEI